MTASLRRASSLVDDAVTFGGLGSTGARRAAAAPLALTCTVGWHAHHDLGLRLLTHEIGLSKLPHCFCVFWCCACRRVLAGVAGEDQWADVRKSLRELDEQLKSKWALFGKMQQVDMVLSTCLSQQQRNRSIQSPRGPAEVAAITAL
jgi:hypothetical protein